jgi:methionine biosynthesis protein MetW
MVFIRKIITGFKVIYDDMKYLFQDKPFTLKDMNYDDYWKAKGSSGIKERFKTFVDEIEEGSSVLDIGCGDGTCLKYLCEKKKVAGEGIDVSVTAVKSAQLKGVNACVGDVTSEEFSLEKKYDYIILSEVIEHLSNPETILLSVKKKFRKKLIVTIPNIGLYRHRLRLLFGRFPIQWAFYPGEHVRYWTVKDFEFWVKRLEYGVEHIHATNGFPILYRYFPSVFGHQIVFVLDRNKKD